MTYTMDEIRVGQRVRYRHGSGAISCCHNGRSASGEGIVTRIFDLKYDPPIGIAHQAGETRLHCVFAHEITEIVEQPT